MVGYHESFHAIDHTQVEDGYWVKDRHANSKDESHIDYGEDGGISC